MTMKTSAAGRAALTQREGCRLNAYLDSVGVATIGVGHTGRASPPLVHLGMSISQAQADAYLVTDLAPMEFAVNSAVKVPMTQTQFDAMVSLAFNIGAGGFTGSTVVHKFNAGDVAGAADAFLMWEKPASLKGRRISERAQFLTPNQPYVVPTAELDAIEAAVAKAATTQTAPVLGPHIGVVPVPIPPSPGWLARTWVKITGKAA